MRDNPCGGLTLMRDHFRDRRRVLQLTAGGLFTIHFADAFKLGAAKKKKRRKRKKKHKPLPFPERCFASCDATCGGCWLQPNTDSLICGEGSLSLEFPCISNADCADPAYPSCVTGYYDRETGEFFPIGDGKGNCSNVGACEA